MIVGEVINSRYEIKMLIGDGGMANVYLAYDRILRKNVAIKMLRYELSKDQGFIKRFEREAAQVTNIEHPNIVASYAIGEFKKQPFIVMEYIRGRTLKDYLREIGPLFAEEAVYVMIQICQGVDHAHNHRIIHRDLKSQNVMIDDELNVKITDFGIALSSNEADMTHTNTIMGSVHYLAPELARGCVATTASDIYSLGVLLYEFLTGTVPFKGEGAVNIALQHMENEIPSVREILDDLSENYDYIIRKATAKKPTHRYPNVIEMIEDLRVAHIKGSVSDIIHELSSETMIFEPVQSNREREEPIPKKKPQNFSGLSFINGILYTILLAVVAGTYFFIVILPGWYDTDHARIPDMRGMSAEEARSALDLAGLDTASMDIIIARNTEVPVGEVFRTNPAIGTRIRILEGRVIRIYIATDVDDDDVGNDDVDDDDDDDDEEEDDVD